MTTGYDLVEGSAVMADPSSTREASVSAQLSLTELYRDRGCARGPRTSRKIFARGVVLCLYWLKGGGHIV